VQNFRDRQREVSDVVVDPDGEVMGAFAFHVKPCWNFLKRLQMNLMRPS
jgi:hypothetical protein